MERPWTAEEDAVLRAEYATLGGAGLAKRLRRCRKLIAHHAAVLGIRCQRVGYRKDTWTPEQDAILRRYYPHGGVEGVKKHLSRSTASISGHAVRLGIRCLVALGGSDRPDTREVRQWAIECGWPADLTIRQVQILNTLATYGPMTKIEVATVIGANTNTKDLLACSSYKWRKANGGACNHFVRLADLGLVACCRSGKRNVYVLTLTALDLLETRLARDASHHPTETTPCQTPSA